MPCPLQRCLSLDKLTSSMAKREAEVSEAKTENQKLQEEVARLRKELEDKTKQVRNKVNCCTQTECDLIGRFSFSC